MDGCLLVLFTLRKLSFYQSLALDDNICKSVSIVGSGAAS